MGEIEKSSSPERVTATVIGAEKDHEVAVVVHDGIEVQIDLSYIKSWPGVKLAASMASPKRSETERFLAMVEYYELAVPNVDEVSEALGGTSVDVGSVLEFLSAAVKEATPKN